MIFPKIKLVVVLVFCSLMAIGQWSVINTQTPSASLSNISYSPDSAIFVTGTKNLIYSKDNGSTFFQASNFTITPNDPNYSANRNFFDVSFINKDTGAIVGGIIPGSYTSFAQVSSAGSSNWAYKSPVGMGSGMKAIAVKCFQKKIIYALDESPKLFASYDNGLTWVLKKTLTIIPGAYSIDMSFADSLNGFMFTSVGNFRTTDGGKNISLMTTLPNGFTTVKRARFSTPTRGYVICKNVANEEKIFKTTDGGITWIDLFQGKMQNAIVDVNFPTKDTGFVIGSNYALNTIDGGVTWGVQRFPSSKVFSEMDFISKDLGVMVGYGSLGNEVLRINTSALSNIPFSVFNFSIGYCCVGQLCNITNYGSPAWSYKWYINNNLFSTVHTPAAPTLTMSGNNTIKLVSTNAFGKDSTIVNIYNAPAFTYTINHTIVDSTICFGSIANLNITGANSQFYYSILSGTNTISNTYNGTSFAMPSYVLGFNDTILTIHAATQYSTCPGNVFNKNQKIKVWQLPPNNIMSFVSDSVCFMDTARIVIAPMTAGTTYSIFTTSFGLWTTYTSTITGQSKTFKYAPFWNSRRFWYKSYDANGCYSVPSASVNVKMDSIIPKFYSVKPYPACHPGDTIKLINATAGATNFTWNYTAGTNVVLNNNYNVDLSYAAKGDYFVYLNLKNNTGCMDSIRYRVGVYDTLTQGGGTLCFLDSTQIVQNTKYVGYTWYVNWEQYTKLHVDKNENYYIGKVVFYSNPQQSQPLQYAQTGFKVSKYDKNGVLKWSVKPVTNAGSTFYKHTTLSSIISDDWGNVYIAGNFNGLTLTIGTKTLNFAYSGSFYGSAATYVAKLDSNGNCVWIMNGEGWPTSFQTNGITQMLHDKGTIYFCSSGATKYNFTNVTVGGFGGFDLVSIDTAGKYINAKNIYSINSGWGFGWYWMDISAFVTSQTMSYAPLLNKYKNKIINTGYLDKGVWSYPSTTALFPPAIAGHTIQAHAYTIITDTVGNYLSAFMPAAFYNVLQNGITQFTVSLKWEFKPHVTLDNAGNMYFTWSPNMDEPRKYKNRQYPEMKYTVRLADGTLIPSVDPLTLIVKYDLSGNVLWYKTAPYLNTMSTIAGNDGNFYGLGRFNSLACFNSANNLNQMITLNDTCTHSLLYAYDGSGNFLWGKPFNSPFNEYPREIVKKDECNTNLYFISSFDTTANFMGTPIPVTNRVQIFKYDPAASCSNIICPTITTNLAEHGLQNSLFKVIPNPNSGSFEVYNLDYRKLNFTIYNSIGQVVQRFIKDGIGSVTVDLTQFNSGVYFITADDGKKLQKEKVIVIN